MMFYFIFMLHQNCHQAFSTNQDSFVDQYLVFIKWSYTQLSWVIDIKVNISELVIDLLASSIKWNLDIWKLKIIHPSWSVGIRMIWKIYVISGHVLGPGVPSSSQVSAFFFFPARPTGATPSNLWTASVDSAQAVTDLSSHSWVSRSQHTSGKTHATTSQNNFQSQNIVKYCLHFTKWNTGVGEILNC